MESNGRELTEILLLSSYMRRLLHQEASLLPNSRATLIFSKETKRVTGIESHRFEIYLRFHEKTYKDHTPTFNRKGYESKKIQLTRKNLPFRQDVRRHIKSSCGEKCSTRKKNNCDQDNNLEVKESDNPHMSTSERVKVFSRSTWSFLPSLYRNRVRERDRQRREETQNCSLTTRSKDCSQ